jgi:hypothetical protein
MWVGGKKVQPYWEAHAAWRSPELGYGSILKLSF